MSLRAMAVTRAAAESPGDTNQIAGEQQQKLLTQLTNLIPAEALAAFVALIAASANYSYQTRLAMFWIVLALTPLWVLGNFWLAAKNPRQWPVLEMFVGTVAFIAWSLTVPKTPFQDHMLFISDEGLSVQTGTLIMLGTSVILGFITQILVPGWRRRQRAVAA